MGELDSIFNPGSVAVVGASRTPGKLGYEILKNIIDAGFRGKIYPVNPKADEIMGLKCYHSISEIPEPVDLAVIVIPARFVPDTVKEAVQKGVKGFVVISGGFREVGGEGVELERRLVRAVREGGARLIGPNCQGINNPHVGLCATWPLSTRRGPVAVVSQSGTVAAFMATGLEGEGIGMSKFAALGNKADVDEVDMLNYLADDPDTEVVALYLEGTSRGRELMEALRRCASRKPVVVIKAGRTEAGAEAVASHTGTLAGSAEVYEAVFRQTGAVAVDTLEEFFDAAKALAAFKPPKGPRVMVITSSGGSGILAADAIESRGMELAKLSEDVLSRLREELPYFCVIRNPLDLTGSAYAELYDKALEITKDHDGIDSYILIFGDPIPGAFEVIEKHLRETEKPILVAYLGGGDIEVEERRKFYEAGIPVYPTPERAVVALYNLWRSRKG